MSKTYKCFSFLLTGLFISIIALPLRSETEIYRIDKVHSGINFKIRNFFSKVPGSFEDFSGTITVNRENPENNSVEAIITVKSIDTHNADRDTHLQGDDFFQAAVHPEILFKSTQWKPLGENSFEVTGNLTMLDKTKEVVLTVKLLGFGKGRGDKFLSGWEATAVLDRREWGITYGRSIGDTVEVELNIQAVKE